MQIIYKALFLIEGIKWGNWKQWKYYPSEKDQGWFSPMTVFSVLFLVKIIYLRRLLFGELEILSVLFTEIPVFLVICFFIEGLANRKRLPFYFIVSSLFSAFLFATALYNDYYNAIITYHSLAQIGQVAAISSSITSLLKPVYLLFFADLLFLFVIKKFKKPAGFLTAGQYLVLSTVCVFIMGICIYTINKQNIINEKAEARKMGVLNYQLSVIFEDILGNEAGKSEITLENIEQLKGIVPLENAAYFGSAKGKDIIVIQMEAIQNFVIGMAVNGEEITPNLNKLIKESFYFPRFYQQIGKGNTADAEFLLNTSIYPVGGHAMSQIFSNKDLPSLPKYLKKHNYESVTFHTNEGGFWNRKELYHALGFDRFYDKEFYPEEDLISYGPSDRILFEYSLDELKKIKNKGKNIYANFITMSSHHPFKIPEERIVFRPDGGLKGTTLGNYLESVAYADAQIGFFINKLKENGMYENTLLVLYGDHYAIGEENLSDLEKHVIESHTGKSYHKIDVFNVPLIIRVPGEAGRIMEQPGGQIDLLPTILNLSGIEMRDKIYFGQDIVNHTENLIPMRFYMPTGAFFNSDVLFVPGEGFADGIAYSLKTHRPTRKKGKYKEHYDKILTLLELSDNFVESLAELK